MSEFLFEVQKFLMILKFLKSVIFMDFEQF